jgi:hypothetical protein
MQNILSSSNFHIVGVPLIFVLIGVFANRLGRRDGDDAPQLNDWSVGTTTLLTALGAIAADLPTAKTGGDFSNFAGWFTGVLFVLFISLDNDRFRSWRRNNKGIPSNCKHLWWGVIFPNLFSCVIFIAYQYSKLVNP